MNNEEPKTFKTTELKQKAQTWYFVNVFTSIMQTCVFSIWIIVLLVACNAPVWICVIGAFYAVSSWVHFFCWLGANVSLDEYREKEFEKARREEYIAGYVKGLEAARADTK